MAVDPAPWQAGWIEKGSYPTIADDFPPSPVAFSSLSSKLHRTTFWGDTTMDQESAQPIAERIETLYRSRSRRIFATLIRLLGDFELAEEALHDAFRAALEQWPRDGMPANPHAWLVSPAVSRESTASAAMPVTADPNAAHRIRRQPSKPAKWGRAKASIRTCCA
jgi:hypothetical protein